MDKKNKSWWPWLGAALVGAGGAAYWAHYKRPLPKLKGNLNLPGLQAPVEVRRDGLGIPTLCAQSWLDAWRALGFVHAQDRLFQMEVQRRAGAGRLSELFGPATLRADRFLRRLSLQLSAQAEVAHCDEDELAMLEAYSQGVNRCIESQPLSSEFTLLRSRPQAWEPIDCFLWIKMMTHDLAANWEAELLRGRLLAHLHKQGEPVDKASAWALCPPADFPLTIGGKTSELFTHLLREYREVQNCLPPGFGPTEPLAGSNAWVISGERSLDGKPMLANDPHLGMKIPDVWYQVRIQLPDRELFGVSMPGMPGLILGQNGKISWGVTNSYIDVHDLFVERIQPQLLRVQGPEGDESLALRQEVIAVRNKREVVETVYTTARGPILNSVDILASESLALSLAWSGRPCGHFFRAVSNLNRADNVGQARQALRDWHLPCLNFLLADQENIAHQVAGRVPRRRPFSGLVPVPAWDAQYAWQGFLEFEELPRLDNPPCGFIVSANHAIAGLDYPHFLSWDFNSGVRAERVEQLLQAREKHDFASFQEIQLDIVTLLGIRFRDRCANLRCKDPLQRQALGLLQQWDGRALHSSCATTIFETTMSSLAQILLERTWGPELCAEVLGETSLNPMQEVGHHASRYHAVVVCAAERNDPRWLPQGASWDDLLHEALALAVRRLTERLGPDPLEWAWGKLHRLELRHPLSRFRWLFPPLGPVAIDGDSETPAQTGVILKKGMPHDISVGASWRYLARLSDLSESLTSHCPGQSGHPSSPHYKDGFKAWLKGHYHRPLQAEPSHILLLNPAESKDANS